MKLFSFKAIGASVLPLLFLFATAVFADSPQLQPGQEEVVLKVENMT